MGVYLGIDIGTSGTKTLAIRDTGRILASATVEYPLSSPRPGWCCHSSSSSSCATSVAR